MSINEVQIMKQLYLIIHSLLTAILAWLSARLGILLPVMCLLLGAMVMDYITGISVECAGNT